MGVRMLCPIKISFSARLSALYAAFFIVSGISQPFLPVWLKAKGLDAATIGLVLAAPMLLRVFSIPMATRTADRRDAVRAGIVVAACLAVAGYTLMGVAEGASFILLAYAFASLGFTPLLPLVETYAFKGLAARGKAYGPVRLWGSATFIVGNLIAGVAADLISARHIIWMIVIASVGTALASFALQPVSVAAPVTSEPQPARRLLRDPIFLAVLAAASLIQGSHAMFYGFTGMAWRDAGLDGTTIAMLWGLGVAAEIVLFALAGRLPPLLQVPGILMMVGASAAALRWVGMAMDPPFWALPWLQMLHALSFGATHLGTFGFVSHYAPPGHGARAQGYLAIAMGLAMACAMAMSGVLFEKFGSFAFMAMALAAVAGGVCALVPYRARAVAPL